jgi:hypothetical protein
MLLKDFKVSTRKYIKPTSSVDEVPMVKILIEGHVVITRDGEHYTVGCTEQYDEKFEFFTGDMLQVYIDDYLAKAKQISENWVLVGEIEHHIHGKVVGEKPFKL